MTNIAVDKSTDNAEALSICSLNICIGLDWSLYQQINILAICVNIMVNSMRVQR